MAAKNWPSPIVNFTSREEGGFSNNPADPGGATEHGITLRTFRNMVGDQNLTVDDLKAITPDQEASIYHTYWDKVHGDDLPSGVDLMVFDEGFNAGPVTSEKLLQRALGFGGDSVDGVIGPKTLAALKTADPIKIIQGLDIAQRLYYKELNGFPDFGKGWLLRLGRRLAASLDLAAPSSASAGVAACPPPAPGA